MVAAWMTMSGRGMAARYLKAAMDRKTWGAHGRGAAQTMYSAGQPRKRRRRPQGRTIFALPGGSAPGGRGRSPAAGATHRGEGHLPREAAPPAAGAGHQRRVPRLAARRPVRTMDTKTVQTSLRALSRFLCRMKEA